MVIAAGMGKGRGEFGVTKRADQRNDPAQQPGGEHGPCAARIGRHQRRRLEDAGAYDEADDQGDCMPKLEHRRRLRGLVRGILALLAHAGDYAVKSAPRPSAPVDSENQLMMPDPHQDMRMALARMQLPLSGEALRAETRRGG